MQLTHLNRSQSPSPINTHLEQQMMNTKDAPKPTKNIKLALIAATTSLLSGGLHAEDNPWHADSALLVYSEADSRVQAVEPIVALTKDRDDEHIISLKLTLDSLTGASPNGALAANHPQTFTGPSGNGTSYTTKAGDTPLDSSFHDSRAAFSLNWSQPLGERNHISFGGNVSNEFDFKSLGVNGAIARDFFNKNTNLSLGFSFESDSINPVGGVPDAFAALPPPSESGEHESEGEDESEGEGGGSGESKQVTELLLGLTQVMNRHWLTQLSVSLGNSSGYHSDPYKFLSVLLDDGSNFIGSETDWYAYENRPDSRARTSIFWGNKIHLHEDVIDISYRFYRDDWGITANTFDMRYRYQLNNYMYLEPHYRWYHQTAADFYRPYLLASQDTSAGQVNVDYASADPRLAQFTGTTFGLKFGVELSPTSEFNLRIESLQQTGDVKIPSSMTALEGIDPYPDLKATTVLIGYSFNF